MSRASDLIESFAGFLAQAERSPLTIKNYRGDLDAFAAWFEEVNGEAMTPAWKRVAIGSEGQIDRRLYTFCVLERLQDGLRRRDLFVSASRRWGDPHTRLLQGPAWEKVRSRVFRTLGRSLTAAPELERLGKQLDEVYRRAVNDLPTNSAAPT